MESAAWSGRSASSPEFWCFRMPKFAPARSSARSSTPRFPNEGAGAFFRSCDCFRSSAFLIISGGFMSADTIKTVGVLGAGTMGNGIAHVFARSGYEVILRDVEQRFLDRALGTIGTNLDREVKKGKISEADKAAALARIHPAIDA